MCCKYLCPSPSHGCREWPHRKLRLVLPFGTQIFSCVSNLMVGFLSFHRACGRRVTIFHVKTAQESCIPTRIALDRGWYITHLGGVHRGKRSWTSKCIRWGEHALLALWWHPCLIPHHCHERGMSIASSALTTAALATPTTPLKS